MAAVTSQGTTLTIDTVAIGQIVSYSGFDGESSEIDVSTLGSTAKEYIVGLEDFGNFSFELVSDTSDAGQEDLRDAKSAGSTDAYVLTLSDNTTASFNASVKSMTFSGGVDDADKCSVTLRITGSVTWA